MQKPPFVTWQLLLFATLILAYVTIASPPALMDDVDSVTAQIARNMLTSGDWVTPRLNGIAYFEKPALRFWIVAISYLIFGVSDWAARVPIALASVALCWLVRYFGRWAFLDKPSEHVGTVAGVVMATCVGLFLFTRILIPDVVLTLTTTVAMLAILRLIEPEATKLKQWAALLGFALGAGFMLKGLVAWVFPVGATLSYLLLTRQVFNWQLWRRSQLWLALFVLLAVCLPWLVLATLRNPPYFDFTMRSEPGKYHGFFWFFFLNEHLFRYLNLRYPRDYNTVPRLAFWLYHLLWLFPWSFYFPLVTRQSFAPFSRAGRVRLFCLCWIGCTLLFFTFSTTQEYYSMPCYPALALLLGNAIYVEHEQNRWPSYFTGLIAACAAITGGVILWLVRGVVVTGEIADVMNYQTSTLSLGKAGDLTLESMAWLRTPLMIAACAFAVGAFSSFWRRARFSVLGLALMMLILFNAARLAMVKLNPYLGSRPLAVTLNAAPPGQWIADDQYYSFSSVFFYSNRSALLLNGRKMNLEYGSYAPEAPPVFISDAEFVTRWRSNERHYLTTANAELPRFRQLVGTELLHQLSYSGGKRLFTNQALPNSRPLGVLE